MSMREFYEKHILSRLITCACAQPGIMDLREQVVPLADGDVLEIGCGGGLNQKFYDHSKITRFAGIDPNPALLEGARSRVKAQGWDALIREGVGEAIPFPDSSFDTVVCTYTLCSVNDQAQVISEMRRVLKPGGKLLFLEHGSAPDPGPRKWQARIEPIWRPMMGNCHLTRQVGAALRGGGLSVEPLGQGYLERAPKFAGWMEWGVARKSGA
ncbi:class I SAM-dependent methyltransferase [Tsuneonella mangrovi]|uniref:class I SAM-dependent methyltransferase n=1 Tax=Tsuneonella mangrovi TaxID=1982042 RepID=UPI000BA26309|nr:class I SAM-dependent methyltransferase [Tsuneonella mangrovi]